MADWTAPTSCDHSGELHGPAWNSLAGKGNGCLAHPPDTSQVPRGQQASSERRVHIGRGGRHQLRRRGRPGDREEDDAHQSDGATQPYQADDDGVRGDHPGLHWRRLPSVLGRLGRPRTLPGDGRRHVRRVPPAIESPFPVRSLRYVAQVRSPSPCRVPLRLHSTSAQPNAMPLGAPAPAPRRWAGAPGPSTGQLDRIGPVTGAPRRQCRISFGPSFRRPWLTTAYWMLSVVPKGGRS